MNDFTKEELNLLRICPVLQRLSEKNYNEFLSLSSRICFTKEDVLLKEEERSDHFFIIISGSVNLYKNNEKENTSELILSLCNGQTVGEMRLIQNRTISLTVQAAEPTVVLCASINKLRAPENHECYEAMLDSIIAILNDRLTLSNRCILAKINEKKKRTKQLIFTVFVSIVFALLLVEVGFALYYAMNAEDFCNKFSTPPAPMPKLVQ